MKRILAVVIFLGCATAPSDRASRIAPRQSVTVENQYTGDATVYLDETRIGRVQGLSTAVLRLPLSARPTHRLTVRFLDGVAITLGDVPDVGALARVTVQVLPARTMLVLMPNRGD